MPDKGAVVIALGEKVQGEVIICQERLRANNRNLKTLVIRDKPEGLDDARASRWAKVNLDKLSPFDPTLYLDADTRPNGNVSAGFGILSDGWELVICPSQNQDGDCLWHVDDGERHETFEELGYTPLQLQAGMMFFRKTPAVRKLFQAWREEWERYRDQDQAALLRALKRQPVKVWLLGYPWSNGAVVQHLYGRCR